MGGGGQLGLLAHHAGGHHRVVDTEGRTCPHEGGARLVGPGLGDLAQLPAHGVDLVGGPAQVGDGRRVAAHLLLEGEGIGGGKVAGQLLPLGQGDAVLERRQVQALTGVGVDGRVDAAHVERQVRRHAGFLQHGLLVGFDVLEVPAGADERPQGGASRADQGDGGDDRQGGHAHQAGRAGRQQALAAAGGEDALSLFDGGVGHLDLGGDIEIHAHGVETAEGEGLLVELGCCLEDVTGGLPDRVLVGRRQAHHGRMRRLGQAGGGEGRQLIGQLLAVRLGLVVRAHQVVELGGHPLGRALGLGQGRFVQPLATTETLLGFLQTAVHLRPSLRQPDCGAPMLHEPAVRRGADVAGAGGRRFGAHPLEFGEETGVAALRPSLIRFAQALVDADHLLAKSLDRLAGGPGGVELVGDGRQRGARVGQLRRLGQSDIGGEQADAGLVDAAHLVQPRAVESEHGRQVGGERPVVIGVEDGAILRARHGHPPALRVDVGEDGVARGPVGQAAEQAVDQPAAFGDFESTHYRDPLVEPHPQLVAGDPQGQLFKTHVVASCAQHRPL